MKHFLLVMMLLTPFIGFNQSKRGFGDYSVLMEKINTASDVLYYKNYLTEQYNESPFYYTTLKNEQVVQIDGKIAINDLDILYKRLLFSEQLKSTEEEEKRKKAEYNELIEAANFYYLNKQYSKAYNLYVKAYDINPSDKKINRRLLKPKKLAHK